MSDTNLSVNMSKLLKSLSGGILDFFNESKIQEAPIGGIRQLCGAEYKKDWSLGSNYYRQNSTSEVIRLTDMQFYAPSPNDDDTKGFAIGSWWVLENGDMYQCSDATTSAAVWNIISTSVPDPTTVNGGGEFDLTFAGTIPSNWKVSNTNITNLHIGSTVTTISEYAFISCSNLVGGLVIPNNVKSINYGAFQACQGFNSLDLGSGVTYIGDYALSSCSGFNGSLTIPNSVTHIGDYAFIDCFYFNNYLDLGTGVTHIGNNAFDGCYGFIGDLVIPNSVTTLGTNAFDGCYGFTGNLTIGNGITIIEQYTFYECYGFLGTLTIGSAVEEIREAAFAGCYGLTGDLTIPDSVTDIDSYAFNNCSGLDGNLNIGSGVTYIGDYAFAGLSILNAINCYNVNAPTLGTGVFDATMLADIHVPVGATGYGATYGGLTVIYDIIL